MDGNSSSDDCRRFKRVARKRINTRTARRVALDSDDEDPNVEANASSNTASRKDEPCAAKRPKVVVKTNAKTKAKAKAAKPEDTGKQVAQELDEDSLPAPVARRQRRKRLASDSGDEAAFAAQVPSPAKATPEAERQAQWTKEQSGSPYTSNLRLRQRGAAKVIQSDDEAHVHASTATQQSLHLAHQQPAKMDLPSEDTKVSQQTGIGQLQTAKGQKRWKPRRAADSDESDDDYVVEEEEEGGWRSRIAAMRRNKAQKSTSSDHVGNEAAAASASKKSFLSTLGDSDAEPDDDEDLVLNEPSIRKGTRRARRVEMADDSEAEESVLAAWERELGWTVEELPEEKVEDEACLRRNSYSICFFEVRSTSQLGAEYFLGNKLPKDGGRPLFDGEKKVNLYFLLGVNKEIKANPTIFPKEDRKKIKWLVSEAMALKIVSQYEVNRGKISAQRAQLAVKHNFQLNHRALRIRNPDDSDSAPEARGNSFLNKCYQELDFSKIAEKKKKPEKPNKPTAKDHDEAFFSENEEELERRSKRQKTVSDLRSKINSRKVLTANSNQMDLAKEVENVLAPSLSFDFDHGHESDDDLQITVPERDNGQIRNLFQDHLKKQVTQKHAEALRRSAQRTKEMKNNDEPFVRRKRILHENGSEAHEAVIDSSGIADSSEPPKEEEEPKSKRLTSVRHNRVIDEPEEASAQRPVASGVSAATVLPTTSQSDPSFKIDPNADKDSSICKAQPEHIVPAAPIAKATASSEEVASSEGAARTVISATAPCASTQNPIYDTPHGTISSTAPWAGTQASLEVKASNILSATAPWLGTQASQGIIQQERMASQVDKEFQDPTELSPTQLWGQGLASDKLTQIPQFSLGTSSQDLSSCQNRSSQKEVPSRHEFISPTAPWQEENAEPTRKEELSMREISPTAPWTESADVVSQGLCNSMVQKSSSFMSATALWGGDGSSRPIDRTLTPEELASQTSFDLGRFEGMMASPVDQDEEAETSCKDESTHSNQQKTEWEEYLRREKGSVQRQTDLKSMFSRSKVGGQVDQKPSGAQDNVMNRGSTTKVPCMASVDNCQAEALSNQSPVVSPGRKSLKSVFWEKHGRSGSSASKIVNGEVAQTVLDHGLSCETIASSCASDTGAADNKIASPPSQEDATSPKRRGKAEQSSKPRQQSLKAFFKGKRSSNDADSPPSSQEKGESPKQRAPKTDLRTLLLTSRTSTLAEAKHPHTASEKDTSSPPMDQSATVDATKRPHVNTECPKAVPQEEPKQAAAQSNISNTSKDPPAVVKKSDLRSFFKAAGVVDPKRSEVAVPPSPTNACCTDEVPVNEMSSSTRSENVASSRSACPPAATASDDDEMEARQRLTRLKAPSELSTSGDQQQKEEEQGEEDTEVDEEEPEDEDVDDEDPNKIIWNDEEEIDEMALHRRIHAQWDMEEDEDIVSRLKHFTKRRKELEAEEDARLEEELNGSDDEERCKLSRLKRVADEESDSQGDWSEDSQDVEARQLDETHHQHYLMYKAKRKELRERRKLERVADITDRASSRPQRELRLGIATMQPEERHRLQQEIDLAAGLSGVAVEETSVSSTSKRLWASHQDSEGHIYDVVGVGAPKNKGNLLRKKRQ